MVSLLVVTIHFRSLIAKKPTMAAVITPAMRGAAPMAAPSEPRSLRDTTAAAAMAGMPSTKE